MALYKERNIVERFFGYLKQFRRVTRYDKHIQNYMGFVYIAAIKIWLKCRLAGLPEPPHTSGGRRARLAAEWRKYHPKANHELQFFFVNALMQLEDS